LFISLLFFSTYAQPPKEATSSDDKKKKIEENIRLIETEEDETVFTGTLIKYLNITDIPGEVEEEEEEVEVSATKKVFNEKFYNQLNSVEKVVYDCLYEHSDQEKPEIEFQVVIEKYIEKAKVNMERVMTSLVFDNPQLWWIESYAISLKNGYRDISEHEVLEITLLTVNFMTKDSLFTLTPEEIYEMNKEIETETEILLYQIHLLGIHSKYGLLKFIHDYIIRNTVYDDASPGITHTIYGPLVKHIGLCSGYSETMKFIAAFFGVNVVIARSLSHEWNFVLINNKWYSMDVTWDDPAISHVQYDEEGKASDQILIRPEKWDYSNLSYDYFLVGDKAFRDNEHELIFSYFTKNNAIVYPVVESVNYVYSPKNDEYVEQLYNATEIFSRKKSINSEEEEEEELSGVRGTNTTESDSIKYQEDNNLMKGSSSRKSYYYFSHATILSLLVNTLLIFLIF